MPLLEIHQRTRQNTLSFLVEQILKFKVDSCTKTLPYAQFMHNLCLNRWHTSTCYLPKVQSKLQTSTSWMHNIFLEKLLTCKVECSKHFDIPRVCSNGSHFIILCELVRTLRELPLNPNGTELGAKSENGARHECTPLMARQEQFECW